MGYNIHTPIRSQKLKKEMLKFLKKEMREYDTFRADGFKTEIQGISQISDNEELSLGSSCALGFHYRSWWSGGYGFERTYYFSILKWIAIQVGRKRTNFSQDFGHKRIPVPYIIHDEDEVFPVFLNKPMNKRKSMAMDR